jgi:hypothetical protein
MAAAAAPRGRIRGTPCVSIPGPLSLATRGWGDDPAWASAGGYCTDVLPELRIPGSNAQQVVSFVRRVAPGEGSAAGPGRRRCEAATDRGAGRRFGYAATERVRIGSGLGRRILHDPPAGGGSADRARACTRTRRDRGLRQFLGKPDADRRSRRHADRHSDGIADRYPNRCSNPDPHRYSNLDPHAEANRDAHTQANPHAETHSQTNPEANVPHPRLCHGRGRDPGVAGSQRLYLQRRLHHGHA